jgi:protein ImuA
MGLPPLERALPGGGLACGSVHEWIGIDEPSPAPAPRSKSMPNPGWSPASALLIELTCAATAHAGCGRDRVVWIGDSIVPSPAALAHRGLLETGLVVRATRPGDRLWAADVALRSGAAAAIVVDGSGFDLSSTRRLQLAAESGRSVCLLARPPRDRGGLTAATTRWLVSRVRSSSMHRRWSVELLRCKGMRPTSHAPRAWAVEQDHASCALRVVAELFNRSGDETIGAGVTRNVALSPHG